MRICHDHPFALDIVKWERSVIAFPFALTCAVLAASGWPPKRQVGWLVVCMVLAPIAGVAFNRVVDSELNAANRETTTNATLVRKRMSNDFLGAAVILTSGLFLAAAGQLNLLTVWLAPIELALIFLYFYSRHFTRWSQLFLGLVLGSVPAAAWIAVHGNLDGRILLLVFAVLGVVFGFDVLLRLSGHGVSHR